jgi:hypothetical protein
MDEVEITINKAGIDKFTFLEHRIGKGAVFEHTIKKLTGEYLLSLQVHMVEYLVAVLVVGRYALTHNFLQAAKTNIKFNNIIVQGGDEHKD